MKLELAAFAHALETLRQALEEYRLFSGNLLMRDGVIQRFEYSFELAWKMTKRQLITQLGEAGADQVASYSKRDLFRAAWEAALILDPKPWFEYLEARNMTSHTYNPEKAEAVFKVTEPFLADATFLLEQLKNRNA